MQPRCLCSSRRPALLRFLFKSRHEHLLQRTEESLRSSEQPDEQERKRFLVSEAVTPVTHRPAGVAERRNTDVVVAFFSRKEPLVMAAEKCASLLQSWSVARSLLSRRLLFNHSGGTELRKEPLSSINSFLS